MRLPVRSTAQYAAAARRVLARSGTEELGRRLWSSDSRLAFVVGSPRSLTANSSGWQLK